MINAISYEEIKKNLPKDALKILVKLNNVTRLTFTELNNQTQFKINKLFKEIARLEGACLIEKSKDLSDYEHGINVLKIKK